MRINPKNTISRAFLRYARQFSKTGANKNPRRETAVGLPARVAGLAYRVSALASATAISARVMIRPGSSSPPEPWTTPVCTITDMAPRA